MGRGLAQDLAQHGYAVLLSDKSETILEEARQWIRRSLRTQTMLGRGKADASTDTILSRIDTSTELEIFKDADFVIENVTENWDIKKTIYPVLDRVCADHVAFAANTSAISITRIASLTGRPDRVIGMHFMNPVPMKQTVEVIRGYHTSGETVAVAGCLLDGLKKKAVFVNDAPGFVSNRVLMLTINEAAFVVQEGVAAPEDVDQIFRECFSHEMGPLATADLIGLDTILYSIQVLYDSFNDAKYRPCPLLRKMVDAGLHGRKSGKGFFTY